MEETKRYGIREGVKDSFDFWMNDRCVTMENIIHKAAKEAFSEWLEKNGMRIMKIEKEN